VTGAPHHGQSDDQLVAAAVRGDTDAFGELVARHQRGARRLAASLVGPSDADDVAQDAFLRAYRSLASFRRQAVFGRRASTVDNSPAELSVQADEQRRLRAALNTMATKDRDVLIFRFLLDYSEEETAIALHCAPGTVKSRTSRALMKLRSQSVFSSREDLDA
jgi:DNA-directed RNA polymerase specialized sigma24 family protein